MGWRDAPPVETAPVQAPRWASAPAVDGAPVPPAPPAVDFSNADSLRKRKTELFQQLVDTPPVAPGNPNPLKDEFNKVEKALAALEPPADVRDPNSFMRKLDPFIDPIVGGANVVASGLSNLTGKAVGGIAGIGHQLTDTLGITDGDAVNGPADTVKAVEEAFTIPMGDRAQQLLEPVAAGIKKVGDIRVDDDQVVSDYFQVPDNPVAQTVFPALGEAITSVGPLGISRKPIVDAVESIAAPKPGAPTRTPLTTAREAGFKVRPSDAERVGIDTPGKRAEDLAPRDQRRDFTLDNQKVANDLAAEDIGAKAGTLLDDAQFEKLKQPHIDAYNAAEAAVTKVPLPEEFLFLWDEAVQRAKFKEGAQPTITQTIGALRRRATKNIRSDVVATQDAGFADQALADKLEAAFGKRLEALGEADMLGKYQSARKALAKIHDVQVATTAGQVDPAILRKIDKKNPGRMTGRLKMIADTHANFPDVTRSSLGPAGKKTVREPSVAGTVKDIGSAIVRNIPGLRQFLNVGSDAFQDRLGTVADYVRRTYFDDYGADVPPGQPFPKPPSGPGTEAVPFTPVPGVTPPSASLLARDLGLEPEAVPGAQVLPETPSRLTADVVPPTRGDVAPEFNAQLEADQLARDLGLIEDDLIGDINGDVIQFRPPTMADQMVGDQQIAARELEQLDMPVVTEQPRRLELERPPGTVRGRNTKPGRRIKVTDDANLENNASGESSASVEAINRVKQEKKAGRERFMIGADDTVTPLTGVDAVDARAKRGQVIVQRGVGADEYTILDRGGLSAAQAKGRVQAAFSRRE